MSKSKLLFVLFSSLLLLLFYSTASAAVFNISLYKGIKHAEVTELQNFLKQSPDIYPEGLVTGYFGILTEAAVKRFQIKYGIVSSGTPETTGYGRMGPLTRAKLNGLLGKETISAVTVPTVITPVVTDTVATVTPMTTPEVITEPACRTREVPAKYVTIQAALDVACIGDRIIVSAGTYIENLSIKTDNLTIVSEKAGQAIISPASGQIITSVNGVKSLVIDGLKLIGDFNSSGIFLNVPLGQAAAIVIQNSVIQNTSSAISVTAIAGIVTIKNNLLVSNKLFGINDNVSEAGTVIVQNNTIAKNDTGYYLNASSGNHRLTNNIIVLNTRDGVAVASNSTTEEGQVLNVSYSNVWNNTVQNYYTYRRSVSFTPNGTGNYVADPLFVSADDYRLRSGSQMIDAGDSSLPKDIDNTRADIGAYFFDQRTVSAPIGY